MKGRRENASLKRLQKICTKVQLELCQLYDEPDHVFNLLALIFEDPEEKYEKLRELPVHKLLGAKYQLVSKYFTSSTDNRTLRDIIKRLCDEYFIYVGYEIFVYEKRGSNRKQGFFDEMEKSYNKGVNFFYKGNEENVFIMKRLIDEYKRVITETNIPNSGTATKIGKRLNNPKNGRSGDNPLGVDVFVFQEEMFQNIPIPTLNPRRSGAFVGFNTFCLKRKTLTGVSKPVLIESLGTDGKVYRQIIKHLDELRQDIIALQIFTQMNHILTGQLKIRTYNVVRFEKFFGAIEYVENTRAFGDIIDKIHDKAYQAEYSSRKCRMLFDECKELDDERKLEVFEEICENYTPCINLFFKHQRDPFTYFKMKKTYTQSVAINSISAYTIGLGDRHCYNILLDAHTGEIVNVDLNLLFDQSKLLRTPEKVPFRMTRNIVSGLIGSISKSEVVSGLGWEVQGLKETMGWVFHLYKKEKTQILSQAKMLKYDPLHWWTICQEKLKIYEIKDKISLFTDADRIMARMKDKLGGFEDGFHLENDSHVCYLLKKATDVNDLIQMFPGWQPWV